MVIKNLYLTSRDANKYIGSSKKKNANFGNPYIKPQTLMPLYIYWHYRRSNMAAEKLYLKKF